MTTKKMSVAYSDAATTDITSTVFKRLAAIQLLLICMTIAAENAVNRTNNTVIGTFDKNAAFYVFVSVAVCVYAATWHYLPAPPPNLLVGLVVFGQLCVPFLLLAHDLQTHDVLQVSLGASFMCFGLFFMVFRRPIREATKSAFTRKVLTYVSVLVAGCAVGIPWGSPTLAQTDLWVPRLQLKHLCAALTGTAYATFMLARVSTLPSRCEAKIHDRAGCIRWGTISMWMFAVDVVKQMTQALMRNV